MRLSRISLPATNFAVSIAMAKQIPCAGRIIAVLRKEDSPLFGLDLFTTDRHDLISHAHSFTSCSGIPNTLKRSRPSRPAPTVCYLQLNWICNRIGYKYQQKIFD